MSRTFILLLFSIGIAGMGCHKQAREFVVFSDPWCGDFAQAVLEAYQEVYPETNVIFKVRSSEVIAQRIGYGDPIDFVFVLDSTLFLRDNIQSRVWRSLKLAPARLVKVRRIGPLNENIPGAGGTMLEASDRPARRAAENWFTSNPELRPADSLVIANFYAQARDYLVNGWVRFGYVPDLLVRQHPDMLETVTHGPEIPGGFHTYQRRQDADREGPNLTEFLKTEKCRRLLADYKIIE